MALKDWRRSRGKQVRFFSNIVGMWENKEGGFIEVLEDMDTRGKYIVNSNIHGFKLKEFKSKPEALKCAKKLRKVI